MEYEPSANDDVKMMWHGKQWHFPVEGLPQLISAFKAILDMYPLQGKEEQ